MFKSKTDKLLLVQRVGMYKHFCKAGDLVMDVGANIGNRVDAFLELKANVIAVEPQAFCRKVLRARFGNKIKIVSKGLGEKEETKKMFIASSSTQISSFSEDWIDAVKKSRFSKEQWDQTELIELTTLERLIEQFGVPAFIKIDVEGFELEVLKGLKTPVPSLSFEYTVPEQVNKTMECFEKVNAISGNYRFNYSIGEDMQFELSEFCDYETFKSIINSRAFLDSSNGDIYAQLHQHTAGI
ncbi:MAG: FkbM family methyltransferase [Ferruginibacter sp.]